MVTEPRKAQANCSLTYRTMQAGLSPAAALIPLERTVLSEDATCPPKMATPADSLLPSCRSSGCRALKRPPAPCQIACGPRQSVLAPEEQMTGRGDEALRGNAEQADALASMRMTWPKSSYFMGFAQCTPCCSPWCGNEARREGAWPTGCRSPRRGRMQRARAARLVPSQSKCVDVGRAMQVWQEVVLATVWMPLRMTS